MEVGQRLASGGRESPDCDWRFGLVGIVYAVNQGIDIPRSPKCQQRLITESPIKMVGLRGLGAAGPTLHVLHRR